LLFLFLNILLTPLDSSTICATRKEALLNVLLSCNINCGNKILSLQMGSIQFLNQTIDIANSSIGECNDSGDIFDYIHIFESDNTCLNSIMLNQKCNQTYISELVILECYKIQVNDYCTANVVYEDPYYNWFFVLSIVILAVILVSIVIIIWKCFNPGSYLGSENFE